MLFGKHFGFDVRKFKRSMGKIQFINSLGIVNQEQIIFRSREEMEYEVTSYQLPNFAI